jgi:hypothetical protein
MDMHALTKAGFSATDISPSGAGFGYSLCVWFIAGPIHHRQESA